MMSKKDERKIIDSLANDQTMEMKYDDLKQMLDAELCKPEGEIDAQLVQEILDALEPSAPDPAQMRAAWPRVKENLPRRQERRKWHTGFVRFAAAAAVICVVLVSTIEDAGAFRWTLIQKIIKPVAETFGITINKQPDAAPEADESSIYSISDAPSTLVTYTSLEEVPQTYDGYVIRPQWLPDGFKFSTGSHFTSLDSEIYSFDFVNDEKWFSYHIHVVTLDSTIYSSEFERNLDVPVEMTVGEHVVTFYSNTEDAQQLAFWIHENAYYMLAGEILRSDIISFIEQMY